MYEGNFPYGHALWPAPVVTHAKLIDPATGKFEATQANDPFGVRFREDHFDPIARIRRGRFYFGDGVSMQPAEWFVQPHPALATEATIVDKHNLKKTLETFGSGSIWNRHLRGKQERPLVLLGVDDRFTIWSIISIEAISSGEELVTLKARSSLGILPEIEETRIPKKLRKPVRESLDAFADESYRSAPISVIDRARDAASQILIAHFQSLDGNAKDLSALAKKLEQERVIVGASAAKIIARLHARAKPSERERHNLRPIREQDAQLAIQCVGVLLCELGWAEWP